MPTLGERLRALRLAKGWSQSELARRASVSQVYISQIESGTRGENLGFGTVRRIARALGVTPEDLAPDGDAPVEDSPSATLSTFAVAGV